MKCYRIIRSTQTLNIWIFPHSFSSKFLQKLPTNVRYYFSRHENFLSILQMGPTFATNLCKVVCHRIMLDTLARENDAKLSMASMRDKIGIFISSKLRNWLIMEQIFNMGLNNPSVLSSKFRIIEKVDTPSCSQSWWAKIEIEP